MRKENSKYVERYGPISGCDSDMTAAISGQHGNYSPADGCGISSLTTPYNTFNSCCNANPKAKNCLEACEECPVLVSRGQPNGTYCAGSAGGSTEDCSTGAKISTSGGMVTCCESGQSCASAEGMSSYLATELCGAFDDLSRACIAIPGGKSARDRPTCVTQTISMPNGKGYSVGVDTYLNSSLNCNNAQDPEQCAVEGALQYFKACRKGSAGPPHSHHGGHHGGKKGKKPKPPSPGPSPNPLGQGNNGGTPGGEIAGIVVGSVAGAIFLLLIFRWYVFQSKR